MKLTENIGNEKLPLNNQQEGNFYPIATIYILTLKQEGEFIKQNKISNT